MDTSKEYIKQCREAVEIQEYFNKYKHKIFPCYAFLTIINRVCIFTWKPTTLKGPIIDDNKFVFLSIQPTFNRKAIISIDLKIDHIIWLPGQDQLQEILCQSLKLYSDNGLLSLLNIFSDNFLSKNISLKAMRNMSMEQLWLAFAMKEKFNKSWDGKDWVKI